MPQDSVASDPVIDNELSTSSSPGAESADTGTPQAGTTPDPATQPDGTSTAATAQADQATDDGNPGQQAAETTQETSAIPNLEKRFRDTQAWATRTNQEKAELQRQHQLLQQELQEMRQQYAGVKPEEVNEWRSSKALKPWDDGSPEHDTFLNLVSKAEFFDELAHGETDQAELQKLQQRMVRAIGPDGLKMLDAWKADVRQQERERRLNPKAFYQKLIREQAQPVVRETLQSSNQQYQQALQGKQAAESWMANKEVATPENVQKVLKYMNEHHMPFDVASAIVERDHFKSQVSNANKAKQSAEEKERLLQGNASGAVSRNPNASKHLNVGQHLKEKGITSSRSKIDELFDLERQGLLPPG